MLAGGKIQITSRVRVAARVREDSRAKKPPASGVQGGGGNTNQAVPNNIRLTSAPKISGSLLIMYGLRPVSLLILMPFLNWDTSIIFE